MPNRIKEKFIQLKTEGRKGFIAYITAGDPDLKTTQSLVEQFEKIGVDLVELGIPFSDPLADGAVNQMAAARSLSAGTTVKKILDLVRKIRQRSEIPIILFTYLNPILKYGLEKFAKQAKEDGVDGILALDLPPEEAEEYQVIMKKNEIETIFLVTPTSSEERIQKIVSGTSGFIYCVSRTGVTGISSQISKDVPGLIFKIRKYSALPIAVGFGISQAAQVRQLALVSDAVVVGSAIVKKIEENLKNVHLIKRVADFVQGLAKGLK